MFDQLLFLIRSFVLGSVGNWYVFGLVVAVAFGLLVIQFRRGAGAGSK